MRKAISLGYNVPRSGGKSMKSFLSYLLLLSSFVDCLHSWVILFHIRMTPWSRNDSLQDTYNSKFKDLRSRPGQ